MLNERQIATLLWIGLLLVAVLVLPTGRKGLVDVARGFLSHRIWPISALLALWSFGLVLIGRRIGIWTDALAADTWFWFFTTAVVLLFNFSKVNKEPDFFKRTAKETFGLTLIFGFLSDLYVLSVPVEFIGQGALAVLAGVSAVEAHQRESADARKLVDGCLSVVGLSILVLALLSLVTNWSNAEVPDLARKLLMPAWMTLGVLPYIYVVALYAGYQMAFTWIGFRNEASFRARGGAKAAVVVRLHGQATLVDKFSLPWATRAAEAGSFRAALAVVDEFEDDLARREQEKRDAADRLIRFAGVDGVDDEGRRLDRREFEETTRALRWIGTCQMGWGRRETGYRADILDVVGDLSSHGLPGDGGITVMVSPDGGSWYAWRRTPSGWVFAIGAAGPPPDQWEYDGPEPPSGFPGESSDWGSGPFDYSSAPNW
ncbi:MAG: hypothetical protein HYX32_01875 [Actinobacteria bacterium]|nr:hypothetical protein [Actinomycetota bacterium]